MSQFRPLSASLVVAALLGACGSGDPAEPLPVGGGSTTATTGFGGSSTTTGTATPTTTTVTGVGGTSATVTSTVTSTSVGGASAVGTTGTTGTVTTTGGGTVTTGAAGSSTVGSVTTGGMVSTTTAGAGGSSSVCSMVSGEEFFLRETECAYCHGADAMGVEGRGPEVRHPPEDYARWLIRNGRMDHPSFPDGMAGYDTCLVSDTMLDEIIAFLNSFPMPTDGAGLYADFCANCHGPDGRGGVTMRDLNGEVHAVGTITAQGHNPTDFSNRREFMPVMMMEGLTQAQIDLITQYLQNDLGLAF